ncbi:hypothetical protein HNQ80_001288 [Anaerosolibacter carboniphilus]|uniref:Uncharacterized protein n=1 Tax=Anaerosolibacter carboniphilus TaxID=1417629 RepID=A0A841KYH7_9FIRM|nr:hypothetical protein [Anaerosolibacter carboniphilus]MBB6215199.1 hypothetical protein [Anaerosolibacter carboniphilus]
MLLTEKQLQRFYTYMTGTTGGLLTVVELKKQILEKYKEDIEFYKRFEREEAKSQILLLNERIRESQEEINKYTHIINFVFNGLNECNIEESQFTPYMEKWMPTSVF